MSGLAQTNYYKQLFTINNNTTTAATPYDDVILCICAAI